MFLLTLREEFSAAHRLPATEGKCAALHGHNWKVEIQVRTEDLDGSGMAIDFHDLRALAREVLQELDHRYLNELPAFQGVSPTAENLARHIFERMAGQLRASRVELDQVRVWESDTTAAAYRPSGPPG